MKVPQLYSSLPVTQSGFGACESPAAVNLLSRFLVFSFTCSFLYVGSLWSSDVPSLSLCLFSKKLSRDVCALLILAKISLWAQTMQSVRNKTMGGPYVNEVS